MIPGEPESAWQIVWTLLWVIAACFGGFLLGWSWPKRKRLLCFGLYLFLILRVSPFWDSLRDLLEAHRVHFKTGFRPAPVRGVKSASLSSVGDFASIYADRGVASQWTARITAVGMGVNGPAAPPRPFWEIERDLELETIQAAADAVTIKIPDGGQLLNQRFRCYVELEMYGSGIISNCLFVRGATFTFKEVHIRHPALITDCIFTAEPTEGLTE